MESAKICVIGAGASGMMAAITAAKLGADVLLVEKNERVGKKILATGNGKCNFSHVTIQNSDYYGSFAEYAEDFLSRFGTEALLRFFEKEGMLWKDKNGYLYPYSEQAATVLDTFRYLLVSSKVRVLNSVCIDRVEVKKQGNENGFLLYAKGEKVVSAKQLIIATGGMASPSTGSDGSGYKFADMLHIDYVKPAPALTKLVCSDKFCKELAGVRSEADISLFCNQKLIAKESGEIQFTEYGLSGIPVFQFSRLVSQAIKDKKNQFVCRIDLFQQFSEKELFDYLSAKMKKCINEHMTGEVFLNGLVNKKIAGYIGKVLQIRYDDVLKNRDLDKISELVKIGKAFEFHVIDVKGFDQAQVTAGGIHRNAVTDDLEAQNTPGLYFVGELLDIDGKCGGYNLQWAFTSGVIAGRAAAKMEMGN